MEGLCGELEVGGCGIVGVEEGGDVFGVYWFGDGGGEGDEEGYVIGWCGIFGKVGDLLCFGLGEGSGRG